MLRFTIRDVLWLMVVVGAALGWILERGEVRHLKSDLARVGEELKSVEDSVIRREVAVENERQQRLKRSAEVNQPRVYVRP